jgi:hypothetical protein
LFHKQFVFKLKTKTNDRNNNVNSSRDRYRSFIFKCRRYPAFASVSKLELTNGYPSNDLPIGNYSKKKNLLKFCRSYYTPLIVIIFTHSRILYFKYYLFTIIWIFYGRLDGYLENGVLTNSKNLIKLNPDLTLMILLMLVLGLMKYCIQVLLL